MNPELLRLCDSMNGHSTAQSPGPTRRARARRVIGLVVMTFFVLVLGLFAADAMFGKGSASMAPAEVPAGRAYSYYQRADGSTSAASIECPSLASRMAGSGDPLCGESFTNSAIAVGVLLAIELALMTGMVLVAGSYRRLRRERRAARQVAVGASA